MIIITRHDVSGVFRFNSTRQLLLKIGFWLKENFYKHFLSLTMLDTTKKKVTRNEKWGFMAFSFN